MCQMWQPSYSPYQVEYLETTFNTATFSNVKGDIPLRKLSRSFFWIDQELVRSGLWQQLSNMERLVYVAIAASVNREGVSLWGTEKLLNLAGCSKEDWDGSLVKMVEWNLVRLPATGELGISLMSLAAQVTDKKFLEQNNPKVQGMVAARGPLVFRTTTTVEIGDVGVESKDSK